MKKSLIVAAVFVSAIALSGCSAPAANAAAEVPVFEQVSVYVGEVADIVTGQ